MRFQPENVCIDFKMVLKVAIGVIVYGTICWDGQFYLRRSKIRGFWGTC